MEWTFIVRIKCQVKVRCSRYGNGRRRVECVEIYTRALRDEALSVVSVKAGLSEKH